jgi:hypothetical protein
VNNDRELNKMGKLSRIKGRISEVSFFRKIISFWELCNILRITVAEGSVVAEAGLISHVRPLVTRSMAKKQVG